MKLKTTLSVQRRHKYNQEANKMVALYQLAQTAKFHCSQLPSQMKRCFQKKKKSKGTKPTNFLLCFKTKTIRAMKMMLMVPQLLSAWKKRLLNLRWQLLLRQARRTEHQIRIPKTQMILRIWTRMMT